MGRLNLTTFALVNGKNNGLTTNDLQEKHITVYLIDFAWFLPEANFVRGAFEDFPVSDKFKKKKPDKPSASFVWR